MADLITDLPDGTQLSDLPLAEMIEQYGGVVDSQYAKASIMRGWINVKPVRGTDTLINRRAGKTVPFGLTPGVRPTTEQPVEFGRQAVTVDTVIMARDNRSMLNEFQTDFNARAEIGKDHGKELGKYFDSTMLTMALKGALAAAPAADLNGAFGAGHDVTLATAGDEDDPDLFYKGIEDVIVSMQSSDIDTGDCVVFVNPAQYAVLHKNDKLLNEDFSRDNGDFANGRFGTIYGSPVVMTNRMPVENAAHILGSGYNVSAAEAKARAIVLHSDSLLVGETIALSSDVYFDKIERQWFIDSYQAYGANYRRADACGAVMAV